MERIALTALPGWAEDDPDAAFAAYLLTADPDDPAHGVAQGGARAFLEKHFEAELVSAEAELTGYFEPVYEGARARGGRYGVPVHGLPEGWEPGEGFAARAEIEAGDLLAGQELAWLTSPLDAFLLQVQGSGRVRLPDGTEMRLGYAGKNGHRYVSLGKLLLERGVLQASDVSMQAIQAWFADNPEAGRAALLENPSYVFFRLLDEVPPELGPIGTSGVPLTAQRSVAVDPENIPLGSLVYLDTSPTETPPRLCVAQDTGGAIKGPGRTDLYCGTGEEAGAQAGRLHATFRAYRLVRKAAP
ncbi:murein transglycosylase A [Vannielia litorea]|uniref:peptidoglycan lytic exotransglycosylase n=1 Tax=Vannielia litorea TaxID=1217970 RepID=A0A1N6HK39_9RHOB|nr:MltA domain-containing protein [Vannielia litorea]SIO20093.1 membrane-bound lytic murein transglycosylase A [Vannielia litorea]